ncbi:tRNA lysidine(34) synthetase TilS [Crassaminicella thermophila]|uniref:tRNA(Ile)-lysidine synthase n=1 Tax=Crassaminicella thermophila TaxID=2599308 RepID=A0A5C0SB24_CRATE|nr:tRNA lysidine(34) synthetase TilS [Crassaminicella thermophila]QEK11092.1 tRNA lysidine(34) synthetase TilS [Crassaminicella thermophila]
MLEKFLETVKKHNMIKKGEGIVVGVSGGPDSISLLHLLWRIKEEYNLSLYAVHLNHQFRGKEADEDADYVEKFCENLGIKSFIFSENVAEYSKKKGVTFEEAGREIRYRLFESVMKKMKAHKIAVAQNMDDQAETVLMRLIRGTGIEGLSAIDYVRDNKIIRPLLDIKRYEIEDYCEKNNLMPRIDKTNLEALYTRNRIRLELIPYIEKHFNVNIKQTLSRTANIIREDKEFINISVQKVYKKIVKKTESEIKIYKEEFEKSHIAIKKRILREAIRELSGDLKNIQNKHIQNLIDLIKDGQVGGEAYLPKGLCAILDYDVIIIRKGKREIEKYDFEYNINIGETLNIKELDACFISNIINVKDLQKINKESYKTYFDLDKLKKGMILRTRREGDRFTPFGMKGSKKLKDFFIDAKIPREERDKIPLVCDGEEIMWIIGHRISEKYKVDQNTKNVLVLTYKKNQ